MAVEPTGDRARLADTLARIAPADSGAGAAARAVLDRKAKPRGSLGRLEDLACRIAATRGSEQPGPLSPAVVVCAADHGVAAEGVSAYPQQVTGEMLHAFAAGGAAVCVLARAAGARLVVADLGVRRPVEHPAVLDRRVRAGTSNAARGAAMTRAEAERCVAVGIELADELAADGVGLVALGDMGIANTTAASAVTAAVLEADPAEVCGRGTGIDDAAMERKIAIVRGALAVNRLRLRDPLGALAAVGGLEIAALTGVTLGCAANRLPVLLDGFITAAAALVAVCVCRACADALIAAHRSPEPGHTLILDALGLEPLLDLGLRLGEGSGAALALPLVASALAILSDMTTFDAAGVADTGA